MKFGIRLLCKSYKAARFLQKIDSVTLILNLDVYINFCLYFPRFLTDLGEIRYKNSASNTVENL